MTISYTLINSKHIVFQRLDVNKKSEITLEKYYHPHRTCSLTILHVLLH